ncbi:MAG: hypothetical protein HUU54_10360 [Ignavibacteriaceae bacterium]|nr:hypothetical protein [Ignavibacteriaceae bacterium]
MEHTHYTETELEKLAIKLNPSEIEEFEASLQNLCSVCLKKFREFIEFYSILNAEISEPVSNSAKELARLLSNQTKLKFLNINELPGPKEETSQNLIVFAAADKRQTEENYSTMAVFSAVNGNVLIRVLKEKGTDDILFYILTDDKKFYDTVLIIVKTKSDKMHYFLSGSDGRCNVSNFEIDDWESAEVAVTAAILEVPVNSIEQEKISNPGKLVIEKNDVNEFVIQLPAYSAGIKRAGLIYKEDKPVLMELIDRRLILNSKAAEGLISVKFYL